MKYLLLTAVLAIAAPAARAADIWALTTADFRTQSVELRAMDGRGVQVVAALKQPGPP